MNLLDRSFGLVVILALLLFSCEEPSEIGLSLNPDDKIGVYYVELPVEANMVYIDSINTSSTNIIYSGVQSDPYLGTTEAVAYTQVSWNSSSIISEGVFDSVTFSLDPDYFYGVDTNRVQNYTVHRVASDTSLEINTYYRSNNVNFESEPLAQGSFLYRSKDDTLTDKREDLFTFNLGDALGLELFSLYKNKIDVVEDTIEFYKNFRGLAIKGSAENEAIVGFVINNSNSKLTLHYHTSKDTLQLNLVTYVGVPTQSGTVNIVPNFSYVTADRSAGVLPTVPSYQEFTANGSIYSHHLAGLIPKLNFSAYKNFVDTAGSFIINKAEIVLGNVETSSPKLKNPSNLTMYLTDDSNRIKGILSGTSGSSNPLGFTYNRENDDYLGDAYFHFSEVKDGRVNFDDVLIYSSNSTIDHFKVNAEDIKLRLYYTKIRD